MNQRKKKQAKCFFLLNIVTNKTETGHTTLDSLHGVDFFLRRKGAGKLK